MTDSNRDRSRGDGRGYGQGGRAGDGRQGTSGRTGSGGRSAAAGRPSSGGGPNSGGRPRSGDRSSSGGDSGSRRSFSSPSGRRADASTGRGGERGVSRGGRPSADSGSRPTRERTVDQATYDGPPLPDEITGRELDRSVLEQLRGLPEKLVTRVARHLVAAGQLLDEDPETAYRHTLAARARASRVAVVREATGEAAYAAGHFAEALSELRAAKRMNGAADYLPVMADCERALGRPERALELAKSPAVRKLPTDQKVEMTIVEAGARFDLGEVDGALRTLEHAPLRSVAREDWVVRLRYAYADLLAKAGRTEDALVWFHRTEGADANDITDAADRVAELEAAPSGGSEPLTDSDHAEPWDR